MMAQLRWIKMSLFLILMLQFAAVTGLQSLSLIVRVGVDVTLPCESLKDDMNNCESTTWLFSDSSRRSVVLVTEGQIGEQAKDKSNRLRVSEKCALVIKNVTEEDAVGRYFCREERLGPLHDSGVDLAVVKLTEQDDTNNEVTFRCFVTKLQRCRHKAKWLFQGQDAGKDNPELRVAPSECYASVTFPIEHLSYTARYNVFECEVADGNNVQKFPFSPPQPSAEKQGDNTITRREMTPAAGKERAAPDGGSAKLPEMWVYIIVAAALAVLIITVAVISWRRTKGNKTQRNSDAGLTSNLAGTRPAPESSQDTADPEDGVSYASVSYTRNNSSKVRGKDDEDEDDTVTYSTVKASSSAADPSDLYATIQ